MTTILLRFWPHLLGLIAVLGLLFVINGWRVNSSRVPGLESQISELEVKLAAQFEAVKQSQLITQKSDKYYAEENADLLSSCTAKLRKQTSCVPVHITSPASPGTTTDRQQRSGGGNGLSVGYLQGFALDCKADKKALNAMKIWAVGVKRQYDEWIAK
jgi:hypothetical protein